MTHLAINGGEAIRTKPWPRWPLWDEREAQRVHAVLES